ncbi:MAG TPA: hypothetical protein VG984_03290 [Candidatus Paceibacterota bacterium]|nr:hypothetical protein [Candidatus Paceibacterota bacterium]
MEPNQSKRKIFISIASVIALVAIAVGTYYFGYAVPHSNTSQAQDEAIAQLIASNNSAELHRIASANPETVGREKWELANLFVSNESFLSPSTNAQNDSRSLAQIISDEKSSISSVARTLILDNRNPTTGDALAWSIFIEKLRRAGFDPSAFTTYVLPSNSQFADAYKTTLASYGSSSTSSSTVREAFLLTIEKQLDDLYEAIATNTSYSEGLKRDLIEDITYVAFLSSGNPSSTAFSALKAKYSPLFYKDLRLSNTVETMPEYKILGIETYMKSIYTVKKVRNTNTAYYWQNAHTAGKDYPLEDRITFQTLRDMYSDAIANLDALNANSKGSSELWSYNANVLRLSLLISTIFSLDVVKNISLTEATKVIEPALATLTALYKADPTNRFFDYMREYNNDRSSRDIQNLTVFIKSNYPASYSLFTHVNW